MTSASSSKSGLHSPELVKNQELANRCCASNLNPQAIGRLIRSKNNRGVVFVCDYRLVN